MEFGTEIITTELLNKSSYKQIITLNTTDISYGSGEYLLYSSSSTMAANRTTASLFNYVLNDIANSTHFASTQYSTSTGVYIGDNNIVSGYNGDWIIVKLPYKIILSSFTFYRRPGSINRAPGEWKCYGSNDGINFTEIIEGNQLTRITTANYTTEFYTKTLSPIITESYQYIGWVVNRLCGNDALLNFAEIQIFGREEKNNNTNIVIKTLNVYDDGYCSQNREAILYIGNDFKIKKPTYHKLISKNLNSISLAMTDDFNAPTNGIRSEIDIGLIIHVKDYKNQQDNNL